MRNDLKVLFLCSGLALACGAAAETAADKLTRLEAETLVLKAREKQLDIQASIIAKQNDIIARQAVNDRLTQNAVAGDPVIRSIEGIGRAMFATLQLSNGTSIDAQAGDVLPNGMRVVSIGPNEVIAENGKKRRVRLARAAHQPAPFNPSYPSPGLHLPLPTVSAAPGGSVK